MGGGAVSGATWNGLTVGDGYAAGTAANENGIWLQGTFINSGGGNIAMHGKSLAGSNSPYPQGGIRFADGLDNNVNIDSGIGTILLDGVGRGTANYATGIEFSSSAGSTHSIVSAATSGNAITIIGDGSAISSGTSSVGVWIHPNTTISATGGGAISITGIASPTGVYNESIWVASGGGVSTSTINAGSANLSLLGSGGAINIRDAVLTGGNVSVTADNNITLGKINPNGNLNVEAVGDLTVFGDITKTSGTDATATLKATGNIIQNFSSISSSSNKLNVILNSDSDGSGQGGIYIDYLSAITSNGGNITLGGGSAGDGSGYARGNEGNGGNAPSDGVNLDGATLDAGGAVSGGNISIKGQSAADDSIGIHLGVDYLTTIKTNYAGTISLDGIGGATSAPSYRSGIAIWRGAIQSESGAISLTGTGGNNSNGGDDSGIFLAGASWESGTSASIVSASGPITLTGIKGSGSGNGSGIRFGSAAGYIGLDGTLVYVSTSNINLVSDSLGWTGFGITPLITLISSGALTVKPKTPGTTIGIAGVTGALSLTANNIYIDFANGFSGITIGSDTAGDITVGNSALTYNAPLTLKTSGNITLNSSNIAGNGNALVLNADSDANGGKIVVNAGSSISTTGGAIVMGGGTCTTSNCTAPAMGGAFGESGITLQGASGNLVSIDSGGGAIWMKSKGAVAGLGAVVVGAFKFVLMYCKSCL